MNLSMSHLEDAHVQNVRAEILRISIESCFDNLWSSWQTREGAGRFAVIELQVR